MMSLKSYTKYGTYIYEEKSNLGFLFFFMKNSNANKLTSQIGLLNNLLNTKKPVGSTNRLRICSN